MDSANSIPRPNSNQPNLTQGSVSAPVQSVQTLRSNINQKPESTSKILPIKQSTMIDNSNSVQKSTTKDSTKSSNIQLSNNATNTTNTTQQTTKPKPIQKPTLAHFKPTFSVPKDISNGNNIKPTSKSTKQLHSVQQQQQQLQKPIMMPKSDKMQRTNSLPITSKPIRHTPVPIQPNPNTAPSAYFHPIAIKPKPVINSSNKSNRSKSINSVKLSRSSSLNAASHLSNSNNSKMNVDDTIKLSTSKNWVLPPRPKTKKVTKKKDKKVSNMKSSIVNSNNLKINSVTTTIKKSPSTTAVSSPISSTTKDVKKPLTTTSTKMEEKKKTCTKCTISPNIRSVLLEPSTGKVYVNAQIHSNINLYTNNDDELKVQLQHVTRENDNLKKILLKLNREIQTLKISKDPVEKNISTANIKSTSTMERTKSIAKQSSSTNDSTTVNVPIINKPIVKNEANIIINDTHDMNDNISNLLNNANTIDPVNLSYSLESKRQKVLSLSPDHFTKSSKGVKKEFQKCKKCEVGEKCTCDQGKKENGKEKSKEKRKSKDVKIKVKPNDNDNAKGKQVNKKVEKDNGTEIPKSTSSSSLISGIFQAVSRNSINILGLGNSSNNGITKISEPTGLNTLNTILKREEIMKKLKSEDNSHSTTNIETISNLDIDMIDDNICGINTSNIDNDNSEIFDFTKMKKDVKKNDFDEDMIFKDIAANIEGNGKKKNISDNDDELLQLIDSELSLDPTPLVSPVLLKTMNSANSNISTNINININTNTSFTTSKSKEQISGVNMTRSKSNNSGSDIFNRSTLADLNLFGNGDAIMDSETVMLFDEIANDDGIMRNNRELISNDNDDFMIY